MRFSVSSKEATEQLVDQFQNANKDLHHNSVSVVAAASDARRPPDLVTTGILDHSWHVRQVEHMHGNVHEAGLDSDRSPVTPVSVCRWNMFD